MSLSSGQIGLLVNILDEFEFWPDWTISEYLR